MQEGCYGTSKNDKKIIQRNESKKNVNQAPSLSPNPLFKNLQQNIQKIQSTLGYSADLVAREVRLGKDGFLQAAVFYTDGLADSKSVNDFMMESLMLGIRKKDLEQKLSVTKNPLELLKDFALTVSEIREVSDFEELFTAITSGDTIILIDGQDQGFTVSMRGWEDRGVTEPSSQTVVRGPREGFLENIRTNTALIRRKIKDPHLWLENRVIGTVTKTNVSIMYIKGIANDKVVEEVRRRLDRINIDGILESGYIEELIQDETYTVFPTLYPTERPDVIAGGLLEGRIAILVDGTPFVLLVPALFVHFFQAAEDYYQRADISFLLRLLRYVSLFISLLGPSLYIAITTYHQEMLPTTLVDQFGSPTRRRPFSGFHRSFGHGNDL